MDIDKFVDDISIKYNYDDRTIKALKKIIPAMINYYGSEYENIIINAIGDTEIIHCNSYQTVLMVLEKYNMLNNMDNGIAELKNADGVYASLPNVYYDDALNSFKIKNIKRKIVISHTFNFDSPKGLEVLTLQLCKLIKSYVLEYEIIDNNIIRKNGIYNSKSKIILGNKGNISFLPIDKTNEALEMGMNINDTENIVSLILKDNYKCYSYDSISTIAMILKKKFKYLQELNKAEILKKYDCITEKFLNLSLLVDECYRLEEEMIVYSLTRDKKDELKEKLSFILSNDIYNCLIEFISDNKKRVQNS